MRSLDPRKRHNYKPTIGQRVRTFFVALLGSGMGCLIPIVVVALNLGLLALSVWVVVKVLQFTGVL